MTVYAARCPLMIRCSLSSMLLSVQHILQDVNRKPKIAGVNGPLLGSRQLVFAEVYHTIVKCTSHPGVYHVIIRINIVMDIMFSRFCLTIGEYVS